MPGIKIGTDVGSELCEVGGQSDMPGQFRESRSKRSSITLLKISSLNQVGDDYAEATTGGGLTRFPTLSNLTNSPMTVQRKRESRFGSVSIPEPMPLAAGPEKQTTHQRGPRIAPSAPMGPEPKFETEA